MRQCVRLELRAISFLVLMIWAGFLFAENRALSSTSPTPVVVYSQVLSNSTDRVAALAVGSDGSVYITGVTRPTTSFADGASPRTNEGRPFVEKISSNGASVVFRTYLANDSLSETRAIAIDANGNAVVTGETRSLNFPAIRALQPHCKLDAAEQCAGNIFVAKVNSQGTVVYSTYLGGSAEDSGNALAIDGKGNIYLAGAARSFDFPVESALQRVLGGNEDAFIAKISADGARILFATYLGGTGEEEIGGLALDPAGNAYVTGKTNSLDFPTVKALQGKCAATQGACAGTAFVSKIAADGSTVLYSTYLGGSGGDIAAAIAVDAVGNAYITGSTKSPDFPLVHAFQQNLAGKADIFLTKLSPDGSQIVFSTYLGGSDSDQARGVSVDASGNAVIAGWTRSADFPARNPLPSTCATSGGGKGCDVDAFIAVVDSKAKSLRFSSSFGGSSADVAEAVAVDSQGALYLGGWTHSSDFPQVQALTPADQPTEPMPSRSGAFIAKFSGVLLPGPTVTCSNKTNNWTGSAGDNQWATAKNWSDGRVPIATDTVCIASTFTQRITISNLASANQQITGLTTAAPITFAGGPLSIGGSSTFDSDLAIKSGVINFNGFASMSTLELTGGVMGGTAGITANGVITWSGGEMCTNYDSKSQTCNNAQGMSTTYANVGLNITNSVTLDSRRLNNVQTASITGAYTLSVVDAASVNNQAGATWTLASDANVSNGGASTNQSFSNSGTFQKTGGSGTSTIQISFGNIGIVQVQAATLDLTGGQYCTGGCSGSWSVASGATLQFDSSNYNLTGQIGGSGAAGSGTVNFATGSATLTGNYNVTGATTIGNSNINFNGTITNMGALTVNGGLADIVTTVSTTIPLSSLTLNGGTLAANDNFTISGMLNWSDGAMCTTYQPSQFSCVAPALQAVTTANGGITIGTGLPALDGRVLNNTKTATMSSAGYNYLNLLDNAVINNNAGATWNLTGDANLNGATGTFNNSGTFEKTGGVSTSTITPTFNNSGKVLANAATLDFVGGGSCTITCAGSWISASGATLQFDTDLFTLSGPISGAGTVSFTSGTQTLTGTYTVTGTTNFGSAVVGFNQTGTISFPGPVNLSGGFVYGTATLAFNNLLTWTYGAMCTVYSSVNASCLPTPTQSVSNANAGISFPYGYPTLDGRTLNNVQTMSMTGSGYFLTLLDGAVINNKAGAVWNVANDAGLSGLTGVFNNLGTFEKTAGTGTSTIQVPFNNAASVQANAAVLDFAGGGNCGNTCAGTWTVGSGGALQFDAGAFTLSGPVTGAGAVTFASGNQTLTGTYGITGATSFSGSAVGFNQSSAVTFAGPVNISNGVVYGSAALNMTGALTWTDGSICTTYSTLTGLCSAPLTQAITNAKGGITFGSGNPTLDGRVLNNTQSATMTSKGFSLGLADSAVVNISNGSTWNMTTDVGITGSGVINNGGTFEKTGGSGISTVAVSFNNSGTMTSTSGNLTFSGTYTQTGGNTVAGSGRITLNSAAAMNGGTLSGTGTISGSVLNSAGTVAPGTSSMVGTITLASSASTYTQKSGGTYSVKIGGTSNGQYDQLVVGGAVTLNGALKITTINGFTPSKGQTFTIIRSGGESGQFSSVPKNWTVTYNRATVVLTFQ